jgi:hypothetical protein
VWTDSSGFLYAARAQFGPNLTQWSIAHVSTDITEAILCFSSMVPADLAVEGFVPDWVPISERFARLRTMAQRDPVRHVPDLVADRPPSPPISWLDVYEAAQDLYAAIGPSGWDYLTHEQPSEAATMGAIAACNAVGDNPRAVEAALAGMWAASSHDPELCDVLPELLSHAASAAGVSVDNENECALQVQRLGGDYHVFILERSYHLLRSGRCEPPLSEPFPDL